MKAPPPVSKAEWEVMKVLWSRSPLAAPEVAEALREKTSWHPKTVKTLINRLLKKGVLGFQRQGRSYLFKPLIQESAYVTAESTSFLDRVFGGALQPMIAHFVRQKKLSPEEIRELQLLLRENQK